MSSDPFIRMAKELDARKEFVHIKRPRAPATESCEMNSSPGYPYGRDKPEKTKANKPMQFPASRPDLAAIYTAYADRLKSPTQK